MKHKKILDSYLKELIITIVIIVALYALGAIFWRQIVDFLSQLPVIKEVYKYIVLEIERESIIGLSAVTFLGSLFFIGYPADLLYLVYLRVGYGVLLLSVVMVFWMMLGQMINYAIGYFIEKKFLDKFVHDHRIGFVAFLKKYDVVFIIIINLLPLPADLLALFLGMVRYDFKRGMLFTFTGRILHFTFLGLLYLIAKRIWFFG